MSSVFAVTERPEQAVDLWVNGVCAIYDAMACVLFVILRSINQERRRS